MRESEFEMWTFKNKKDGQIVEERMLTRFPNRNPEEFAYDHDEWELISKRVVKVRRRVDIQREYAERKAKEKAEQEGQE